MDGYSLLVSLIAIGLGAVAAVAYARSRAAEAHVVDAIQRMEGEVEPRDLGGSLDRAVVKAHANLSDLEARVGRYEAAITAAEIGIIVTDRSGNISVSNPIAERFVNARLGDAVAEARLRDLVERVARTGEGEHVEVDVYTPKRRFLRLTALPLDPGMRAGEAIVYIEDLTDQRRVDLVRRDFVANVSHELKTPLGALAVLAETLADADDPDIRRKLTNRMQTEAGRMARMVDDILSLAHLDGAVATREPVRIDDVLEEACRQVSVTSEELSVELLGKPAGDDVMVAGDRAQLTSAISNLLENAMKYTVVKHPEGGVVWYRAHADDDSIYVEVEDRGIGIPEAHRDRIFERFYRVDRARSRQTGGTGLGLSIVRNVVLNHGGNVAVESEPGWGSTFTIELPRYEP